MAAVLGAMFPAEKAGLDALADEAGSRIPADPLHFDNGRARLGRTIAAWALEHDVMGHEPFALR